MQENESSAYGIKCS